MALSAASAALMATTATPSHAEEATANAAPSAKRPPNIVFVLIDDMGYADLSTYGNRETQTPAIDRLAKEGIKFTQFAVASPICSPSRTALTTGQYPARWGILSFLASRAENKARNMKNWLDPKAPTLARYLHDAGYATGHFGKWHMGGQRDVGEAPLITEYGFDASLTQFEGLGDRVLAMLDDRDGKPPRKMPLGVGSEKLGRGNISWVDRAQVTTEFTKRAMQFMQEAKKAGKPFYVNVWPDDVHSPFFPSAAGRGAGTKHALYQGVVGETDVQLAPLFDMVRNDPELRDNTLIVVASDNGPEPGAGSAGPFRGHKGQLYEGGFREPFITWGPGLVKNQGTVNNATVLDSVDFLPSILNICGVKRGANAPMTDGEDMSAALLGTGQPRRRKPIFWLRPSDRAQAPNGERFPDLAVRDGDWKLLVMEDGTTPQLYDLSKDVGEKNNLAASHPDVVARLSKLVLDWRKTLPVTMPPIRPAPSPSAAEKESS